jgi:DNA mismatch repair ATPase MutS
MPLQIDDQTFDDLEVFRGRDGRPGLVRLFDCAKTGGGANVLRRRFRNPHSASDAVRATQDSIRYILRHADVFKNLPSEYAVAGFENYFHGQVAAPARGGRVGLLFDMLLLEVDDPRDFAVIRAGVLQGVHIAQWFERLISCADEDSPLGEISPLIDEARVLLDAARIRPTLRKPPTRWPFWKVLSVDRMIREGDRSRFERLIAILYEIDALTAMSLVTERRGFVLPEVVDGPAMIDADGAYHPFLDYAVANPIAMTQDARLLFLTGPNMAGKTTYLRTCGVAIFLAHVGMGVPALRFRFTPMDALLTAISLSDDVRAGISFFQAEALRAQLIAKQLAHGIRVVAIMDEPFKGTNVKDALDASCEFLVRIARRKNSLFLVASHLIEAAGPLRKTGRVQCSHFAAVEGETGLHFDYLLRAGVSSQRLGMRVLEDHQVFELLDGSAADHADAS